jgi:hypothetical protein
LEIHFSLAIIIVIVRLNLAKKAKIHDVGRYAPVETTNLLRSDAQKLLHRSRSYVFPGNAEPPSAKPGAWKQMICQAGYLSAGLSTFSSNRSQLERAVDTFVLFDCNRKCDDVAMKDFLAS